MGKLQPFDGKHVIIKLKVGKYKVLILAHISPIVRHWTIALILHAIRVSMDWPGLARYVKELCTTCPSLYKAGLAIVAKGPLKLLPTIRNN